MKIDISKQIEEILEEEVKLSKEALEEAAKKVSKETVAQLKQTSPKDKGRYARSWKAKKESGSSGSVSYVIHNDKHSHLTHLLEKGHALRGGGRTRAFPHIKQAEEKAIADFEQELVKRIERG